ncbi:MAG TPA: hypothetical protein VKB34_18890 [Povalibacter sp.]|nr:hypothetical protein [Povalibacter sp.]
MLIAIAPVFVFAFEASAATSPAVSESPIAKPVAAASTSRRVAVVRGLGWVMMAPVTESEWTVMETMFDRGSGAGN